MSEHRTATDPATGCTYGSNTVVVTASALTITSVSPAANAKAAPAASPVTVTFNQSITSGSTTALAVFSQ